MINAALPTRFLYRHWELINPDFNPFRNAIKLDTPVYRENDPVGWLCPRKPPDRIVFSGSSTAQEGINSNSAISLTDLGTGTIVFGTAVIIDTP